MKEKWAIGLKTFVKKNNVEVIDGHLILYKAVRSNYSSWYRWMNKNVYRPGTLVEIPRGKVSDNRSIRCGPGLHVGTLRFVKEFAANHLLARILVKVAVRPENVVCVPIKETGKIGVCQLQVLSRVDRKTGAEIPE